MLIQCGSKHLLFSWLTWRGCSFIRCGSDFTLLLGWFVTLVTGCLKIDAVCLIGNVVFRSGLPLFWLRGSFRSLCLFFCNLLGIILPVLKSKLLRSTAFPRYLASWGLLLNFLPLGLEENTFNCTKGNTSSFYIVFLNRTPYNRFNSSLFSTATNYNCKGLV